MNISVFLSYPRPYLPEQEQFIEALSNYLTHRGFQPRTLGVTDYDMDAPLKAIRRLMLESNGIITVAFRRALIAQGKGRPGDPKQEYDLAGQWMTSPYSHIEPAMAFQIGLPVLIIRESGVIADGILEKGVIGTYMPEFDLSNPAANYLSTPEWNQIIRRWEGYVAGVVENKGNPPKLY